MKPTVAILSIGVVPVDDVRTLLMEHVTAGQMTHISLLGNMSRDEVLMEFAPEEGEESYSVSLNKGQLVRVSSAKVSLAMQNLVSLLDRLDYDVILLMNTLPVKGLSAQSAILLEPDRITPPLVASIVSSHRAGIILPFDELIQHQQNKWRILAHSPLFEVAPSADSSEEALLDAGKRVIARGATAIILDHLLFTQKHKRFLEEHFSIPVILASVLLLRLATELLA